MILLRLRRKRQLSRLEQERNNSDCIIVSPDDKWFISLGQTRNELMEYQSARILMWHENYRYSIVHMDIVYSEQELFIGDIVSRVENKGYGSKVLEFAISLAKTLSCTVIRGNLGVTDVDHFDKLKYWYEKYGFTVKVDGSEGSIALNV